MLLNFIALFLSVVNINCGCCLDSGTKTSSEKKNRIYTKTSSEKSNKIYSGEIYVYCLDDNLKKTIEKVYDDKIKEINKHRNITRNDVKEIENKYIFPVVEKKYGGKSGFHAFRLLDGKEGGIEDNDKEVEYPYEIYYIPDVGELGMRESIIKIFNGVGTEQEKFDTLKESCESARTRAIDLDVINKYLSDPEAQKNPMVQQVLSLKKK